MRWKFEQKWTALLGRVALTVVGLTTLVVIIAWLSGMFETKVAPGWTERGLQKLADQPTALVHEVEKSYVEEAVGALKASSRTVVSAKVLATIDDILVSAGDQVQVGQMLIRLEGKEFQSRLEQARQALEAATANREEAEKQFTRMESLAERNAASRAEFDKAARDVQVTLAEEARAAQAVTEAEVLLSYTTIEASKNGRIVDRLAEPGDVAQPGMPLLVLYDATSLRLETPVMEHLAIQLREGQQLDVFIDALNKRFQATIDEIVPQADAPSRSFLVKTSLPKSEDLYEGMFGRLLIPAGERRHLCLQTDAIVRQGQLEFVDVVLPDQTIERRLIKTGQLGMPGRQEVLSGVQPGERVILQRAEQDGGDDVQQP